MNTEQSEIVELSLGRAEALVLFELLADFYDGSTLAIPTEAERLALVRLHGALEKTLLEPFARNYRELLDQARAKLRYQAGTR